MCSHRAPHLREIKLEVSSFWMSAVFEDQNIRTMGKRISPPSSPRAQTLLSEGRQISASKKMTSEACHWDEVWGTSLMGFLIGFIRLRSVGLLLAARDNLPPEPPTWVRTVVEIGLQHDCEAMKSEWVFFFAVCMIIWSNRLTCNQRRMLGNCPYLCKWDCPASASEHGVIRVASKPFTVPPTDKLRVVVWSCVVQETSPSYGSVCN